MNAFLSRLRTLYTPFQMAAKLGKGSLFSRERLDILSSSFLVLWGVVRGKKVRVKITLWFRQCPLSVVVEDAVDFALIREVFLDEEYAHQLLPDVQYIFDAGANAGVASLYFHCLYPNAIIYAFEPNAALFPKLKENVGHISSIVAFPYALSDHDGEIDFYIHPTSSLASSTLSRGDTSVVQVPARRLSSFAKEASGGRIDIVKFDIEGAERALFSAPEDRAARLLIGEVHLDLLKSDEHSFLALFPEFDASFVRETGKNRRIMYATKKIV